MATFYLGQRVKLARNRRPEDRHRPPTRTGGPCECVIVGTRSQPNPGFCFLNDYSVRLPDGRVGMVMAYQLEPLTPPHQLADAEFTEAFDKQFREVSAPVTP